MNSLTTATLISNFNDRMNVIRFIAIASVIWGHCLLGLENKSFSGTEYQIAQAILIQGGRVGTIMFFVISGFFLGDKIAGFTPVTYLRYRFRTLIMPWLLFVLLITLVQLFGQFSFKQLMSASLRQLAFVLWTMAKGSVFHAAYWFVPVTIFSSLVLIYFKKFAQSVWFPLFLASISLFYSVNLYTAWLPVAHTKALLGYVFYMWLGMQVKNNIFYIKALLNKTSGVVLFIIILAVFLFACKEGVYLTSLGSADAFASLRLSNAVLSILVFAALLKSHRLQVVIRFRPQKKAFGLYLIHSFMISMISPLAVQFIEANNLSFSLSALALIQIVFFLVVFVLAYGTVYMMRRSALCFLIGVRRVKEQMREDQNVNETGLTVS